MFSKGTLNTVFKYSPTIKLYSGTIPLIAENTVLPANTSAGICLMVSLINADGTAKIMTLALVNVSSKSEDKSNLFKSNCTELK